MKNKIVFLQIASNRSKILKIVSICTHHFIQKEKLLIIAKDDLTCEFVDDILWKYPQESFLPHRISDTPCDDYIIITKGEENLNGASYVFNLTPSPLLWGDSYSDVIYEFDDSNPSKIEISKDKFKKYREKGFLIESR